MQEPKSTAQKLLEQAAKREKTVEQFIENEKEYQAALNRLASSKDGQYVFKRLINYCGVYDADNDLNARLIENNGKRKVYLQMIRKYLTKQNIMEIEQ